MKTIVITFAHLSWQKGSVAQVVSFVKEWRRTNGPTRFVLVSQYPELDELPAEELGVEIAGHSFNHWSSPNIQNLRWLGSLWLAVVVHWLSKVGIARTWSFRNNVIRTFFEADLVADLSGDSYRDRPGGFAPAHNALLFGVRLLGKPLAIVSQSLGPFRSCHQAVTACALNGATCIYVREKSTIAKLEKIGVKLQNCILAPDVAFVLPKPQPDDLNSLWREATEPDTDQIWVGISMNCLMLDFTGNSDIYIGQMAEFATYIHETYGTNILLVPHVFHSSALGMDDVVPCSDLAAELGHPKWLSFLQDDHSPVELKGIISCCEVFIAARMHAGIASLSSGVPTIFLSWSHKYRALLEEIGLEQFTWESRDGTVEELILMFDDLWRDRVEIRKQLEAYTAGAAKSISDTIAQIARNTGLEQDMREAGTSEASPTKQGRSQ